MKLIMQLILSECTRTSAPKPTAIFSFMEDSSSQQQNPRDNSSRSEISKYRLGNELRFLCDLDH